MSATIISLELPASFQYLNVLGACIGAMLEHVSGHSDTALLIYNVQTAAQELATNIVAHSFQDSAGRFAAQLALDAERDCFVVETRDAGSAFDPLQDERAEWRVQENTVPPVYELVSAPEVAWDAENGRGLFLMRALMDVVTFQFVAGENCWRMEKSLSGRGAE